MRSQLVQWAPWDGTCYDLLIVWDVGYCRGPHHVSVLSWPRAPGFSFGLERVDTDAEADNWVGWVAEQHPPMGGQQPSGLPEKDAEVVVAMLRAAAGDLVGARAWLCRRRPRAETWAWDVLVRQLGLAPRLVDHDSLA